MTTTARLLFTAYAPVHFACFQPVFERLRDRPGIKVFVSGGTRTMSPHGVRYDQDMLYEPFGLPEGSVLSVEEIREMDFDVFFSASTGRIEPRGFDRSVQIFHGMSFRNVAIREEVLGFDHYWLVGPYMRRGFEQREILAPDDPRAVEIGFPKTDRLLDGSLDRDVLRAAYGLAGDRPVVLYAPTGGKGNSLETMGEEVLGRLADLDTYDVLVKLHDHPKGWIDWHERLAPLEGDHLRILRTPDVVPVMFLADLLISDASSVSNEYALLDRPIVFLDVPELLEAARVFGAFVDLETWGRKGGQVVADARGAVEAVVEGLDRPGLHADVRHAMVRDLFFNPGRSTEAAVRWLETELGLA